MNHRMLRSFRVSLRLPLPKMLGHLKISLSLPAVRMRHLGKPQADLVRARIPTSILDRMISVPMLVPRLNLGTKGMTKTNRCLDLLRSPEEADRRLPIKWDPTVGIPTW